MIKELVQFTEVVLKDPLYSNLGITPREGLHIVLELEQDGEQTKIANKVAFSGVFNKKTAMNEWFMRCTAWWKSATMLGLVDANKLLDNPAKAIHTVSPFCFAVKRTNLEGGEKYAENHTNKKPQVYERINAYFANAVKLIERTEDKVIADAFRLVINNQTLLEYWMNENDQFNQINDGDYVVFYLNLPIERYDVANKKYLKERLFNTAKFNIQDPDNPELLHGTNNWLNGFSSKKPFLTHRTASFDINGRISLADAQVLAEFSDLVGRRLFPNPLPLFIMEDERSRAFKIFKEDAFSGEDKRKPYLEIIQEIQSEFSRDVGNYYLLFLQAGEIRDFDFVSKFEFNLNSDGSPWVVKDLFNIGQEMKLSTVQDLLTQVLPPMFNNALVVRRKEKEWIFHWFDEIAPGPNKKRNAFLLSMKYRKAFYDFIYKSQRQGITGNAIREIFCTGILDDIRLDEYKNNRNSEGYAIRFKMNLLFNLHQYFSSKKNPTFMPDNITALRAHLDQVASGLAQLETDEHFAFAAGQVIDRIFYESNTADKSYKYLEPFLSQTNPDRFKIAIGNFIKRYKHVEFPPRFRSVCSDVLTYPIKGDLQKLLPVFMAGVFSKSQLYWESRDKTSPNTTEGSTENSSN